MLLRRRQSFAQHYESRPDQSVGGGRKRQKSKDDIGIFAVS